MDRYTLAAVAALAVAGCLGAPAVDTPTPTDDGPTTTTATTTTTTPTTYTTTDAARPSSTTSTNRVLTDCPYHLQVDPAEGTPEDALAYANLSAARQQEFQRALENGTSVIGTDLPETWSSPRTVEYRGDYYRAVVFVC